MAFHIAPQNIYRALFNPLALAPDMVMMARF